MCNNCSKNDFAIGVVLGAVLGAGAALLLAPDSGKETREKIKKASLKYAKEGKDRLDEVSEEVSRRAVELGHRVQEGVEDAVDETKDAFQDTKDSLEEKMRKIKKQKFTGIE